MKGGFHETAADVRDGLVLLLAVVLAMGTVARAEDTPGVRTDAPKPAGRGPLDPLPVKYLPSIGFCQIGGHDVPCTKLTVKYDDGTERSKTVSVSPEGSWEKVLADLGKEMDKADRDHDRILNERRKADEHSTHPDAP